MNAPGNQGLTVGDAMLMFLWFVLLVVSMGIYERRAVKRFDALSDACGVEQVEVER